MHVVFCLPVYLCTSCMSGAHWCQKKESDPLKLQLQTIVNCRVDTGTWTQALYRNSHLSSFSVLQYLLCWYWCICSNLFALCLAPPTVWSENTWRWEVCDETVGRRVCAHACCTHTAVHACAHARRPEDFGGCPALSLSPCSLETGCLTKLAPRLMVSKPQPFSKFCPQCWAVPHVT